MRRPYPSRLAEERELVPGEAEAGRIAVRWGHDGIRARGPEPTKGAQEFVADEPFVVQLSRSSREVTPGWFMRTLGHDPYTEHRVHMELRSPRHRLRLWAVVQDIAVVEGLAELELDGLELEHDGFDGLLDAALALGAAVAERGAELADVALPPPKELQAAVEDAERRAGRAEQRLDEASAELDRVREGLAAAERQQVQVAERVAELEAREEKGRAARRELQSAYDKLKSRAQKKSEESEELATVREERDRLARRVALLTADGPTGGEMKALDEHNFEMALDPSHMADRAGVCCPVCRARGEVVEMFEFGFQSEHQRSKSKVQSRGVCCPRCGYSGRQFLPRGR